MARFPIASAPYLRDFEPCLDALRRFGPLSMALAGVAIGFFSSMVFGAFASYPYFPSVPGWAQYPEPVSLTQEKILFNGVLALAVIVGVGITLVLAQRSALGAALKALLRISTVSLAAWVVVYSWRLTGRDAIGTEAGVLNTWLSVVFVAGLVLLWVGLLAGAVDLGIRRRCFSCEADQSLQPPPVEYSPDACSLSEDWLCGCGSVHGAPPIGSSSPSSAPRGVPPGCGEQPAQSVHDADRTYHPPR